MKKVIKYYKNALLKESVKVEVMAIASNYSMVRRPGCTPIVVKAKDLSDIPITECVSK